MATYRKLPSGKWQAQVATAGARKSKSFASKRDAIAWAVRFEEAARTGTVALNKTFAEALEEYRLKVAPSKRDYEFEDRRIRYYQRDPIATKRLADLRVKDFDDLAARRLGSTSNRTGRPITRGTLARDMNLLSAVLHWCQRQGYLKDFPLGEHGLRERGVLEDGGEGAVAVTQKRGNLPPVKQRPAAVQGNRVLRNGFR